MLGIIEQSSPSCDFQQWNALLHGTTGNCEEVLSNRIRKPAVALSQIRRNRQCRAIKLIGQKAEATRKALSEQGNRVSQRYSLLVDLQILEHEGHLLSSRRAEDQVNR